MEQPLISDYALLSNCRISALVSREGSIDWLCLPDPASPSLFGFILDTEMGGNWWIRPDGIRSIRRRYLGRSNVLETTFECDSGVMRLTDGLQIAPPDRDSNELVPDHELTRRVECVAGSVRVRTEFTPRPGYGRLRARVRRSEDSELIIEAGGQSCLVRSDLELNVQDGGRAVSAEAELSAGQTRWMSLAQSSGGPEVAPMIGDSAERRLQETVKWWDQWSSELSLPEVGTESVLRSAVTLKSLAYPPTGAVLAAPTSSLPEEIGGHRNWDYRYCWIRDASFTMRALLNLDIHAEAASFFAWLLYATRLTWPRLQVLYDVHGRTNIKERELDHLCGYLGSRPVRIGNAAISQLQLDPYGALLDAAWMYHHEKGSLDRAAGRMLRGFVLTARDLWREPDRGIWEIRSGPRHHTLSKAMCWVAMDRGLRLARDGVMTVDEDRLQREMDNCRACVEEQGFNQQLGCYTATLNGTDVDASLLLLSIYGFERADSERMHGTIDRIYERLGDGGAALYRYINIDDGVSGKEGQFGICGFWGVEALARAGRVAEAREGFESLMSHANDVGLFAEEIDMDDGRALGNFPQALSHVGVINAACTLARASRIDRSEPASHEAMKP